MKAFTFVNLDAIATVIGNTTKSINSSSIMSAYRA